MTEMTVCLLNWKRPANVGRIIDCLKQQTARPRIFLWDNNAGNHGMSFRDVDWLVASTENRRCWPRWFMASQAETPYVMSLDDDLMPADNRFIGDLITELKKSTVAERIIGIEGVILREGHWYQGSNSMGTGGQTVVDIVKGRLMAMHRTALMHVPLYPPTVTSEDDIAISGILSRRGNKQQMWAHNISYELKRRTVELPDNDALWKQPGHFDRRDQATKTFFPYHRGTP